MSNSERARQRCIDSMSANFESRESNLKVVHGKIEREYGDGVAEIKGSIRINQDEMMEAKDGDK